MDRTAVFVDAGYLFAAGSKLIVGEKLPRGQLNLDYDAVHPTQLHETVFFLEGRGFTRVELMLWGDHYETGPTRLQRLLSRFPVVRWFAHNFPLVMRKLAPLAPTTLAAGLWPRVARPGGEPVIPFSSANRVGGPSAPHNARKQSTKILRPIVPPSVTPPLSAIWLTASTRSISPCV